MSKLKLVLQTPADYGPYAGTAEATPDGWQSDNADLRRALDVCYPTGETCAGNPVVAAFDAAVEGWRCEVVTRRVPKSPPGVVH